MHSIMCLKCIDFFGRKGRSFVLGMSGLAAPIAGCVGFFLSRRFDNIRWWRFGGIRGVFREFSDLVGQFSIDFNKFSNLFFKSSKALNIELFCFGSQILSSCSPVRLLSDKFRGFLENNIDMPPWVCYNSSSWKWAFWHWVRCSIRSKYPWTVTKIFEF